MEKLLLESGDGAALVECFLPPRPRAASVRASPAGAAGAASTVASVVATSVSWAGEAAPCRHAGYRDGASSGPHGEIWLVRVMVPTVCGSVPGSVTRAGAVSRAGAVAAAGVRRRETGSHGIGPGGLTWPYWAGLPRARPVLRGGTGAGAGVLAALPLLGVCVRFRCGDSFNEVESHLCVHMAGGMHRIQGPTWDESLFGIDPIVSWIRQIRHSDSLIAW